MPKKTPGQEWVEAEKKAMGNGRTKPAPMAKAKPSAPGTAAANMSAITAQAGEPYDATKFTSPSSLTKQNSSARKPSMAKRVAAQAIAKKVIAEKKGGKGATPSPMINLSKNRPTKKAY